MFYHLKLCIVSNAFFALLNFLLEIMVNKAHYNGHFMTLCEMYDKLNNG